MFINYHQHRIIKEINPYLDYHPKDCVNEIEFGKTNCKAKGQIMYIANTEQQIFIEAKTSGDNKKEHFTPDCGILSWSLH